MPACLFLIAPALSAASVSLNNADCLYLNSGDVWEASGVVYKNVSIIVQSGARIELPVDDDDSSKWSLQLIAPRVYIGGTLCANEASFNTAGCGLAGGTIAGPGGSGFGGAGGDGHSNEGSGGLTYDVTYRENTGSKGINSKYGGGGGIRIDAMSLTLASAAVVTARASEHHSGGGGSGGSIFLNGIYTRLENGCTLDASGGAGQIHRLITYPVYTFIPGGGGGGGGRIKTFKYPYNTYTLYHNYGAVTSTAGGLAGGGSATDGTSGQFKEYSGYLPSTPALLAPDNGQQVGVQPAFNFISADNPASQFFQYQLEISQDATFTYVSNTVKIASQLTPDAGWDGVNFCKSAQMATYSLYEDLDSDTDYYWRVKVTNCCGAAWTGYSSVRGFHTINNQRPLEPVLINPGNSQTAVSKTPALRIFCVDPDGDTLTFSIVLSQNSGLANPKIIQASYEGWDQTEYPSGNTATCQVLNTSADPDALEPGKTYYWRVTAYDPYQMTRNSPVYHFQVVDLPATPVLASPAQQAVVSTITPSLQMQSESPTGSNLRYRVELSSDEFQTIITYLSENGKGWDKSQYASGETATLQIPQAYALVSGISYAWRAAAYDVDNDNWSSMSEVRTFTVVTPPLVPQLLSPPDQYTAADSGFTFQFLAESESGNTLTYRVQLSEDRFQTVWQTYDQESGQGIWSAAAYASNSPAAFVLPETLNLARGKNYQWRVLARDGYSWSPCSEIRSFTLAAGLNIEASKLYPNPAVSSSVLHVTLRPSVDADATVHVLNAQAKEIRKIQWDLRGGQDNDVRLDISGFAPGTYFLLVEIQSPYGNKKITKRFAVVN